MPLQRSGRLAQLIWFLMLDFGAIDSAVAGPGSTSRRQRDAWSDHELLRALENARLCVPSVMKERRIGLRGHLLPQDLERGVATGVAARPAPRSHATSPP